MYADDRLTETVTLIDGCDRHGRLITKLFESVDQSMTCTKLTYCTEDIKSVIAGLAFKLQK